jgi:hypothetical protein
MNISHRNPHDRGVLPLLAIGLGFVLLAGCHKNDEDTMTAVPPATTPTESMPAEPSTMTAPMPASTANAHDADGTSNEAASPSSVAMPPPVDTPQPTQGSDATSGDPATPTNDDGY